MPKSPEQLEKGEDSYDKPKSASERPPLYGFAVPESFERFIDTTQSSWPEEHRKKLGELLSFAFVAGQREEHLTREGLPTEWPEVRFDV